MRWTLCAHLGRQEQTGLNEAEAMGEPIAFHVRRPGGTPLLDGCSNRGIEPAGRSLHVRLI
jgi:hypothetical protein